MRNTAPSLRRGVALAALVLSGCAELPQRTSLPVIPAPSPNFDQRRPQFVVLHHTGSAHAGRALRTLTDRERAVSAHYLVARDGRIYHLVDELARAWHAGESYWAGNRDLNSASIGIELDNAGEEPYPEVQMSALLSLLGDLRQRYRIPRANYLGHADVAPRRKADPGRVFPWRRLAASGFGLWCEPPFAAPPATPDDATLLAAFGYDPADADAAVSAFKLRFAPDSPDRGMTADDRAKLWCLLDRRNRAED
jgi:N-acetylmuramoyl-L-alanine amidase